MGIVQDIFPPFIESTDLCFGATVQCQRLLNEAVEVDVRVWQHLPEDHIVVQVAAEDRRDKSQRRVQLQGFDDVFLHILGRRGCQSQTGNRRHELAQRAKLEVVRPEVVAPLGDAVSLVHSQVGEQATGAQVVEARLEGGRGHHLWSDVEHLELWAAAPQIRQDQTSLGGCELRVDGADGQVETLQPVHLVLRGRNQTSQRDSMEFVSKQCNQTDLDEGDQRGYNQGDAFSLEGRELVAQRLASSSGHAHKHIPVS